MRHCLILLFLLCSCHQSHLAVFTDTVSYENLASFHVGTPDPSLACPDRGQRLVISWSVTCPSPETTIRARIRFANLEETELVFALQEPRGHTSFNLLNGDYDRTGGILTYKVWLLGRGNAHR